ncbi:MAG TPA: branched-chain amino acid ABC transporter permease [Symbiobacteriaceae bacterium]
MAELLSITVNAIFMAGLYAAMSFGLALIYGVMKIINLAHAGVIMLGAFFSFTLFQYAHIDPFVSIIVAFPVFSALGMALHRYVVSRLPESGNTPAVQSLLLLFGVWLMLQNLGYYVWGSDTQSVLTTYTLKSVKLGPITVGIPILLMFLVGVVTFIILNQVMTKTYLGKAIRAVTQNRQAALLVGINARKIAMIAFGIGTGLAGVSGSMMSALYAFTPDFGRNFLLKAFCIIVLGGMESLSGVAVGALVVALAEAYVARYLVSNVFQDAITFALLVVALVVMPQGLPGLSAQLGRYFRTKEVARS